MVADVHYFSPTTPGAASFDVDVSDFVRRGRIGPLSGEAQMAAVGSGSTILDDIDSTVGHYLDGILGLKQWYWNETDCPVGNQRVFTGYTFDRNYERGDSLVLGPSRLIDVTVMDPNAFLSFRVFAPEDVDPTSSFNRPAETTLERLTALLAVDFLSTTLFDLGYIPTTGAKDLDAHDYTGQKPFDVVNDIAQVTGWNPWVGYDETANKLFLWFDDWRTDGSATVAYDSTLKLTNVESEAASDVLLIEMGSVENVDPSRVISAVYVMGKGTNVYRSRPTTAYTFGWRDAVMEAQFLSDTAKLEALGDRYLLDNSTEDHRITLSVQVPSSLVTAIHEGMRIQLHATHMPSCAADFTWCRILHRTVRRDIETMEFYWLDLELSPIPPIPCPDLDLTPEGFYAPISASGTISSPYAITGADGVTYYGKPGTVLPLTPTPGFAGQWSFFATAPPYARTGYGPSGVYDAAVNFGLNKVRLIIIGDGTLTCYFANTLYPNASAYVAVTIHDNGVNVYSNSDIASAASGGEAVELVLTGAETGTCLHIIDIGPFTGSGGNFFAWAGADWVPAP